MICVACKSASMKAGILLLRRVSPCGLARKSRNNDSVVPGRAAISLKLGAAGFISGGEAWSIATTWQFEQILSAKS